ncbi:metallophosphoesterase, partial [Bacillus pumilus]
FKTSLPVRFEIAEGRTTLSAVIVEIDEQSKKAVKIDRILINDDHIFFE